ncbi:MAG: hypothetical protein IJK25_10175, partial [Firmicutes bacterium]|nr:hypothetical protein [Bacillota bacterium]
ELIVDSSYDPVYGARPMKRFIQSNVETLLARAMLSRELTAGTVLTVDAEDGKLVVR